MNNFTKVNTQYERLGLFLRINTGSEITCPYENMRLDYISCSERRNPFVIATDYLFAEHLLCNLNYDDGYKLLLNI